MKHYPHDQHVYLCGPIEGLTKREANEWRDEAKVKLALKNIDVLDPTRRVSYVDSKCMHADAGYSSVTYRTSHTHQFY